MVFYQIINLGQEREPAIKIQQFPTQTAEQKWQKQAEQWGNKKWG